MKLAPRHEFQLPRDTPAMRVYAGGTLIGFALTLTLYVFWGWPYMAVLFGLLYALPAAICVLAAIATRLRPFLFFLGLAPLSFTNFALLMVLLPTPHILVNVLLLAGAIMSAIHDGRAMDHARHRPSPA